MSTHKKIILGIFFSLALTSFKAQMYSEPEKTEVKKEKTKKTATPKDPEGTQYLGAGFILNGTAALSYGITSGNYDLNTPYTDTTSSIYSSYSSGYTSKQYPIKNSIGYRLGIGIGFQSRSFGLELPIMFCVDRFKVPDISAKEHLKISSFEFGLNQNWRFAKEKAFVLIGEYIAVHPSDIFEFHSIGLNFGAGYVFMKNFNVSIRYKYNFFSLDKEDGVVELYKNSKTPDENGNTLNYVNANYNSLQLVLRYDLVNMRKMKTVKKKEEKIKKTKTDDNYEYLNGGNVNNPPVNTKPAIDYTTYSDSDLNLALKEANSKTDLDAMLAIQKELDKRKQADEFSKYSYVQLEQELNKALDKEDYKRADMIKKEMAKRDTQKGIPSDNKSGNSLENKSIEELTKLKDEAVQKEDYQKAKEIQDLINKKKP